MKLQKKYMKKFRRSTILSVNVDIRSFVFMLALFSSCNSYNMKSEYCSDFYREENYDKIVQLNKTIVTAATRVDVLLLDEKGVFKTWILSQDEIDELINHLPNCTVLHGQTSGLLTCVYDERTNELGILLSTRTITGTTRKMAVTLTEKYIIAITKSRPPDEVEDSRHFGRDSGFDE